MRIHLNKKSDLLFFCLGLIFLVNALMAEFIGVKIFSLEKIFNIEPFDISFFNIENLSFQLTAGVVIWPIVFVMTDIINEYFGKRGVKFLTNIAIILICYAFFVVYVAIVLPPADFWPTSHLHAELSPEVLEETKHKVGDYNFAFSLVFGQGLWIIIGSLIAFLVGQIIDVMVFHKIKKYTGEKLVWLRATGSTVVSQFIDSFVVLFIAFYIGANWSIELVLAIGLMNYIYKFIVAILMTPLIYLCHNIIDKFLGEDLAKELKFQALK